MHRLVMCLPSKIPIVVDLIAIEANGSNLIDGLALEKEPLCCIIQSSFLPES